MAHLSTHPAIHDGEPASFPTPGEYLLEEFMEPLGISRNALARAIHVQPMRISEIVAGKRSITARTAARLGRFFRTSPLFWMNLQAAHDLRQVEERHEADGIEACALIPA